MKHEATWNLSPASMVVLNCFSTVLEVIFGSCLARTRHHLANLADMSELKSTNIRSTFALSFCLGILEQIITGPVLVLYLYQIALGVQGPVRSVSTGPNSLVGFNQGVCGVVKLLSVAPIGWLVDRDPTRRVRRSSEDSCCTQTSLLWRRSLPVAVGFSSSFVRVLPEPF